MRDDDKQKVYSAEWDLRRMLKTPGVQVTLAGARFATPDERKFGRVEDVQRYVDSMLAHVGHEVPCAVRQRRGHTKAHYEGNRMALPDNLWCLRETVVLHELAHHFARGDRHGPAFRSAFCELIEAAMGPEARFMLQVLYFERGLTA